MRKTWSQTCECLSYGTAKSEQVQSQSRVRRNQHGHLTLGHLSTCNIRPLPLAQQLLTGAFE